MHRILLWSLWITNIALVITKLWESNAKEMWNFRPISFSSCSVKIFSKVMTNTVSPIGSRRLSCYQTTFVRSRFILESVFTTREVIHELHRSGVLGLSLNLIMTMLMIGWTRNSLWKCSPLEALGINGLVGTIKQSSFCVRLIDFNGPYFIRGKGLKQGPPLQFFLPSGKCVF